VTDSNFSNRGRNKKMVDFTSWASIVRIPDVPGPQGTRAFDVALSVLTGLLPDGVGLPPLPVWDGDNTVTAAKCFHRWLADAKRVACEPLYDRERAKVAQHLPGTVCEPLVFSSLGSRTPATIRLPRGGARKEAAGVQSRTRQNGFQQISKALLSSVITRFDALQLSSSDLLLVLLLLRHLLRGSSVLQQRLQRPPRRPLLALRLLVVTQPATRAASVLSKYNSSTVPIQ
jgi:hypothetical protein